MAELLVFEEYAYLNDEDRQRHGVVDETPGDKFEYQGMPPEALWRVEGPNGTMLSAEFQAALSAFQMGGNRMVKIEIIEFDS